MRRVKKKKGNEGQRTKPPTPTRAIDALIGDEEQNGNRRKKKKKERRSATRLHPSYPGPFGLLLRPARIIL